ncbi:MAG: AAA family ATPase [Chloroflexi bacterium]|nr:AAA family ATPase [Chloroflexota bacterium]
MPNNVSVVRALSSNEPRESGFIGRQQELAVLTTALDEALSGRGQMVMLSGEPGIGKTRLAQELASRAQSLGAEVMWGWCYEGDGAPPYWPWTTAITSYVERLNTEELASILTSGNTGISEIIPQIAQKLPGLAKPPALVPDQARFQLFDSVATFLNSGATSNPMLVVLEDLHWADHASLMLLEFVISAISGARLMLLGTYRDVELGRRHPLSLTLGKLLREASFQRIHLNAFDPDEVSQFVESRVSISLDAPDLELIHNRTGGNPLFLNELMRLQVEEADPQAWKTGLPEGVRDVIGRRLDRLSEKCNEVLSIASGVGPEFTFNLLRALLKEVTGDRLLELVEEALSARVIEQISGASGGYRFAHALIQETLQEELSMTGRVRLHVRIAQAIEQIYGQDAEIHAAELAHHYYHGAIVAGTEKMVHYSKLAGDHALAVHAPEEALLHYQRGLAAKEEQAIDDETAALLFGLGRAQAATIEWNQEREAVATLVRAFDYYAEVGEVARAIEIAEFPLTTIAGHSSGATQLISKAIALVNPNSPEAGRLLSRLGIVAGQEEGDYEGAKVAFDNAVNIAQKTGDVALEMRTLAYAAQVDFFSLNWTDSLDKARRAVELGTRTEDHRALVIAHYSAVIASHSLGDQQGAGRHAQAMLAAAERLQDRYWLVSALSRNELASRLDGDWQSSRNYSNRGLEISSIDPRILCGRALLEHEVGNYDQGEYYLELLRETMARAKPGPNPPFVYSATAFQVAAMMTGNLDRLDDAERISIAVLSSPSVSPLFAQRANAGLAITAILRNDTNMAAQQYDLLIPAEGTLLVGGFGAVDRFLGLLSQTLGNLDQAAAHFDDALAFCRRAGYRPELAWTCCDYADALLERADEGDRSKAVSLLDESLTISTELGMRPLMARVTALLEGAETLPVKAPAYPDGLTAREIEVLQLIAIGKSNQEIADALVITLRTAGNHVANILNKTGLANRTEAAAYAIRQGIA